MSTMSLSDRDPNAGTHPPATSGLDADRRDTGILAAAIRVVSGLTLLSRFAGLARDVVTARIFGDGVLGSAFRAAYALPNLFRRLFGEGALSAAFLPQYALLRRDDPAAADQLASLVVRLLTLVTSAITLAAMAVLALLLLLLPADAERALSFRLMLLMLPMMPAVCLTAILGGMLQAHGRFAPPAAAPIILNLFQIAAGLAFYFEWTADRDFTAYMVGAAAVLASAVQIVWSWWALRGRVVWSAAGDIARRHAREVWRRFLPATLGLGTLQLNTMVDMLIAMWPVWVGPTILGHAFPLDAKSNAVLSYTQTIYQFPLGVFGIAVATAIFPMLSRAADRHEEFVRTLRRGLRLSLFIGLPASLGLALVRHDLVAAIFGGGGRLGFSDEGVTRGANALLGFAVGVWAYSLNHVYTRAFYARHDTITPMRLALAAVALNFLLNISLIWWLREAGMAWATGLSAVVQCIALAWLCRTRLGIRPFDPPTVRAFLVIALAAAIMAAAVLAAQRLLPDTPAWRTHVLRVSVCVGAGAAAYALAAIALRLQELRWLFQRGGRGGDVAGVMTFE